MVDKKVIAIGFLILTILISGIIYVSFQGKLQIRVDPDKTTFYVKENNNFVIAGVEYSKLYNGTKTVYRDTSNINISREEANGNVIIKRTTPMQKRGILIDTYVFNPNDPRIEQFPIAHSIEIINASGMIYQYEVQRLVYTGDTKSDVASPQYFGRNMKVQWSEGNYYSKIYRYSGKEEAKITIKYRVNSDYETHDVKLFDPIFSALLNGNEAKGANFLTTNLSDNYDEMINAYMNQSNTTQLLTAGSCIGGNSCLWVPWMDSSSSCAISNLKTGGPVNSTNSNFTYNLMVNDEFSQVGIALSMGKNQTRMDQWFYTVMSMNSSNGQLPAWQLFRNGTKIEPCFTGVNANCDTASDATHRTIIALFTAANNSDFTNTTQKQTYWNLANNLTRDSLRYEIVKACYNTTIGTSINPYGMSCYWLATGAQASISGLGSSSFTYTGYFADAIVAFEQACAQTKNLTYCAVAANLSINYLQASYQNGTNVSTFRTPPGQAFHWVNFTNGAPAAVCDQSCNEGPSGVPVWDTEDAPRASGWGYDIYYANLTTVILPNGVNSHYNLWLAKYANANATSDFFYEYFPNGSTNRNAQSSYNAMAWKSFLITGSRNATYLNSSLRVAINHYQGNSRVMDSESCFGTYNQMFTVRALGIAIGRDLNAYPAINPPITSGSTSTILITLISPENGSTIGIDNANLSVLVQNYNISLIENITTDSTFRANYSFDNASDGFTGNYGLVTGGDGYLNITGNTLSPDTQLARYTEFKHVIRGRLGVGANNVKIYFQTPVGSLSGDRWFFENHTGLVDCAFLNVDCFYIKYDGGAFPSIGPIDDKNSNFTLIMYINRTVRSSQINITWNNGTANGSLQSAIVPFTANGNTSIYENGTGIEASAININPDFRIYEWDVYNTGLPTNTTTFYNGNSSMNVTFYNATDNKIISSTIYAPDGSSPSVNWSGLSSGIKYWFVSVRSQNNVVNSSNFTFTVSLTGPNITILSPLNETIRRSSVFFSVLTSATPSVCTYSLNGVKNYTLSAFNSAKCFQEQANGSSTCGRSDGGYLVTSGTVTITYPKPQGANNESLLQVRKDVSITTNYSIPATCINAFSDKVVIRLASAIGYDGSADQHSSIVQCDTGNGFQNIKFDLFSSAPTVRTVTNCSAKIFDSDYSTGCAYQSAGYNGRLAGWVDLTGEYSDIYEEGITWNISAGYGAFNTTLEDGNYNTYFFCNDSFGNVNNRSITFYLNATTANISATLGDGINSIYFQPNVTNLTAIEPKNQTANSPLFFIVNNNTYTNLSITLNLNDTNSDIDVKCNTVYDYATAFLINNSRTQIIRWLIPNQNMSLWCFADYRSPLYSWKPRWHFEGRVQ